jgi:hypothetical protein
MERSTLRRLEDVENDLQETKVKRWGQRAVDREEWASEITEINAIKPTSE